LVKKMQTLRCYVMMMKHRTLEQQLKVAEAEYDASSSRHSWENGGALLQDSCGGVT
jgi:hypothetical protein